MVSAAGLGSGLDIQGLVDDLMKIERKPLTLLENKQSTYEAQLSAYGKIKSAMSDFESAMKDMGSLEKFQVYAVDSGDENKITATVSSAASVGSYNIIVSQLASTHKLASTGFSDSTSSIGQTGTIRITVGTDSFDVVIDNDTDSLEGIKNQINLAADNTGVKATILNVDDGVGGTESRLVLTADDSGSDNAITIADVSGIVAATLDLTTEMSPAQDAKATVDGFNVTSSTNSFNDVVEGLNFTVKELDPTGTTLTVTRDTDAVLESAKQFVDTYNKLLNIIDEQSKRDYDNIDNNAILSNDSSLRQMKSDLREELLQPANNVGEFSYLFDVGITSDPTTGRLTIDDDEFNAAMDKDFSAVSRLFADSTEGYAVRYESLAKSMQDDGGIIEVRTDGINSRIESTKAKIEREERHLEIVEERYRKQFNAMDTLYSQFTATSDYLTAQLSNMTLGKQSNK